MPCPYFEPLRVALKQQHPGARLPLLDEYEGRCHAVAEQPEVPIDVRFRCCNHGNAGHECARFPMENARSSTRFDVLGHTSRGLEILCVQERNFAPVSWQKFRFLNEGSVLDPEPPDVCVRAQALAFCRSFLQHYPKSVRG